jgi:hypothetical protein
MGRYGEVADHQRRVRVEPEDDTARIFYAARDGRVVATSCFSWDGGAPFSQRRVEHYPVAPFLAELPPEVIAVGERGRVQPELPGSEVFTERGRFSQRWVRENRVGLIFGTCEPHLLSLNLLALGDVPLPCFSLAKSKEGERPLKQAIARGLGRWGGCR